MTVQQDIQRRMTREFIAQDPTTIALIPQQLEVQLSGSKKLVAQDPREPQDFKLIPMTFDQRPTVTADGVERIISYTLLGAHDCALEVWDTWSNDEGTFLVVAMAPGHGYEKKGLVEHHLPVR
jgi:hypothetical protein